MSSCATLRYISPGPPRAGCPGPALEPCDRLVVAEAQLRAQRLDVGEAVQPHLEAALEQRHDVIGRDEQADPQLRIRHPVEVEVGNAFERDVHRARMDGRLETKPLTRIDHGNTRLLDGVRVDRKPSQSRSLRWGRRKG